MNGERPLVVTVSADLVRVLLGKADKVMDQTLLSTENRGKAQGEVVEALQRIAKSLEGVDQKLDKIHQEVEHFGSAAQEQAALYSLVRGFLEKHSKMLWGTFACIRIVLGTLRDGIEEKRKKPEKRDYRDRHTKPVAPQRPEKHPRPTPPLTATVGEQIAAKGEHSPSAE
jgi:hypothetical protein